MYWYYALLVGIAAFLGTITGFGTSTFLIPLLIDTMGAQETLLFVALVHWFGDLTKGFFFRRSIDWRIFFIVGIPALCASFVAGFLPAHLPVIVVKKLVALVIAVYGVLIVFGIQLRFAISLPTLIAGGIFSGVLSAVTGIGGMVRGAFLSAFPLSRYAFIGTLASIGFAIDSARISAYLISGASLSSEQITLLCAAFPLSIAAVWCGRHVLYRLHPEIFRKIVGLALCILALRLLFF